MRERYNKCGEGDIECEQGEPSRETGGSNERVSEGDNEFRKKRDISKQERDDERQRSYRGERDNE